MMLFEPFEIKGLRLKNRITMTPLYLGYGNPDGTVSPLMLRHYQEMASSGVAMVVVEHIAVSEEGLGSPFMLRADDDRYTEGLSELARTIKDSGAIAFAQINHTGRYAYRDDRVAPSPIQTYGKIPKELTTDDIERLVGAYAMAAKRIREAGFDGVEIHGGTGYLLVQFLSPRTNRRTDQYGGSLENRMRFPLRVVEAVMEATGKDFPVGYRFLADEWLPDGLHLDETTLYARELEKKGIAYLSVMAGTYDSFVLPEYKEAEKKEGYMAHFAEAVKKAVSKTPVIVAGRIQTPEFASDIIEQKKADLIGLARALFADPLWPRKAKGEISDPVVKCEPLCSLCSKRILKGKPAYCSQWDKKKRDDFHRLTGESAEEVM